MVDRFCNQGELNRLEEDMCYIDRRNYDSRKPLKYVTYHFHPYGCKVQATCYPGQFYSDGHVNACNIDDDSALKIGDISGANKKLTNINTHQELPMLPIQFPRIKGCLHADTESDLRWESTDNWKPCTNVTEQSFNPHRFQYFKKLCFNPQDPKYIIEENSFIDAFNDSRWSRSGISSRHSRIERYRNGSDVYSRVMQTPNTSYVPYGY